MTVRILPFDYIPDPVDRADAEHGNCIYLFDDDEKKLLPLYFDCDKRIGFVGKTSRGFSEKARLEALKFICALGYVPVEETWYV